MGNWGDQTHNLPTMNRVWLQDYVHGNMHVNYHIVAFWYGYLSPTWMHQRKRGVLSLGDVQQEMSLGVGLLKKIVAGKKEFIGRSYENSFSALKFGCPPSIKKMTQQQHLKLIPRVQLWDTLFFLLLMRHIIHPFFFQAISAISPWRRYA